MFIGMPSDSCFSFLFFFFNAIVWSINSIATVTINEEGLNLKMLQIQITNSY